MSDQRPEPMELSTALIAGLALQANQLATAAEHLREAFRFSRQLKFIIGGFVVLVAGLIVVAGINLSNGHATRTATSTIKDCTTPGGTCYERGQAATQAAVEEIVAGVNAHTNLVLLATLECTRHPLSDAKFAACLRAKGVR
jgi:hypothetical protein